MRSCRIILSLLIFIGSGLVHAQPQPPPDSSTTREFIASCTYGVLAGTLVGAASLAFTDRPGDSLNRVARGASLGLYTGILLGLYVVYVVPGMEPEAEEDPLALALVPTTGQSLRPDGASAQWIFRF